MSSIAHALIKSLRKFFITTFTTVVVNVVINLDWNL